MCRVVFAFILSCTIISSVITTPIDVKPNLIISENEEVTYRLENNTIPLAYHVQLTTNIHQNDFSFLGTVTIQFRVRNPAFLFIVHARQLTIESAHLIFDDEQILYVWEYDEEKELLTFSGIPPILFFTDEIYTMRIKYQGTLRTDNAGFYRSSYIGSNNEIINIATTQFESTNARHAFPCFDEPGYKAKFTIEITHGYTYSALSNMPVDGDPIDNTDGTITTKFQETPPMSTYLVAFIVSNFKNTQGELNGIPHRVYSRPESENTQAFGLSVSRSALKSLENNLRVQYNLPKMDNVAIPDFAAGAMENWGLVTYREEYLLFDNDESTSATQLNIAIMIAHEFTHQWFGDLVTPTWWTYLWLNEGFASLFEYTTVDEIFPKWDVMQIYTVNHFQRALLADSQASPRPMSYYVEKPNEISNLFDTVSYAKAACVLRTFQHALSDATFKRGLTLYLINNYESNADEDDLFASLSEAAKADTSLQEYNIDLKSFFESWTNQGGFPLLTVTRNYKEGSFLIFQTPFDGTESSSSDDKRNWVIPYNYATASDPNFDSTKVIGFLNKVPSVASAEKIDEKDWIIFNKQVTSYYRVNYDLQNWELISKALSENHTEIHTNNRAQLIDDSFRLALAKILSLEIPLNLLTYIEHEKDYAPWAAANSAFNTLNTYLSGDEKYDLYQFYIGNLIKKFYKELTIVENLTDAFLTKRVRSILVDWACKTEQSGCREDTNKRLNDLIDNGKPIEPNMRNPVFCNGLIQGGEKEFDYVFQRILDSFDQAERRQLMTTLGCSQNQTLLMKFLQTSIETSPEINYREQEKYNVLSSVVGTNQIGLQVTIDFLLKYHEEYHKLAIDYTGTSPLLTAIRSIASKVVTVEQNESFENLLNLVTDKLNANDIEAARTTVRTNMDWIEANRDHLIEWFQKFKEGKTDGATSLISFSILTILGFTLFLRSM